MDSVALQAVWAQAWPWICAAVAAASTLDAVLPQPVAGSHWIIPRKILSFVAVNLGNASNGKQPSFATWIVRIASPILQAQGLVPAAKTLAQAAEAIPAAAPIASEVAQALPDAAPAVASPSQGASS